MRDLSPVKRQLVMRLFARGVTTRKIAERLQIGLSTVIRLTRGAGRRPVLARSEDDPPPGYNPARLRRCPGCGGLVYVWPCLMCLIRGETEGGETERRRGKETKRQRGEGTNGQHL